MAFDEQLAEKIRWILKGAQGVEEKRMFGGIGFLINGNMACGVHKDELMLRLGPEEFATAMKHAHARVFDITGKPMKGWALVSREGYRANTELRRWVQKSIAFASSLPPK